MGLDPYILRAGMEANATITEAPVGVFLAGTASVCIVEGESE